MGGLERRVIREVQEHEDHQQHDRQDELQPGSRAFLVLPPAAPADVVPRWQRDVPCDGRAGFLHEAPDVAALHVQEHRREQQAVLRRNHRGTAGVLDASDLAERDLRAVGRGHEDLAERLRIRAVLRRIPNPDGKPLTALDRRRQRGFPDGGLDHLLDVADADAVARGGAAVDLDVEVLTTGDLFGVDVARARHPADGVSDLPRQFLEHGQVGAEDLHAHFRADAGRQHVDAVDDRHRPDVGDARKLHGSPHLGAQPIERHARPPLVPSASGGRSSRSC